MLIVLLSLLAPGAAHADTLYVDHMVASECATYDVAARACGAGAERAFHRIQDTFGEVAPGDVVEIRGGVYDEERAYGPAPNGGVAGSPVTFRAYAGEAVHVQGDVDPHVSAGVGSPFRLFDVDHVVIEGLEISGFFQGVVVGGSDSVRSGPADFVTLRDLHVHDCGLGIYVLEGSTHLVVEDVLAVANYRMGDGGAGLMIRDGADIRVERMIARDNDDGLGIDGDGDGFHVETAVRVTLIDTTAENNSEDGYDLTGDEITLVRCVADRSGAVGLKLWDEHSDGDVPGVNHYVVDTCIVRRSGEAGIFAANGPHVRIVSSVVHGNAGEGTRFTRGLAAYPDPEPPVAVLIDTIVSGNGRWGRRFGDGGGTDDEGWDFTSHHDLFWDNDGDEIYPGEGEGTLYVDPRFADADAGDFHLLAGSPAIDSGADPGSSSGEDFDRVPRPQGAAWDIGAFEFVVPGTDAGARDAAASDGGGAPDGGARDAGIDGGGAPAGGGCSCRASGGSAPPSLALIAAAAAALRAGARRSRAHPRGSRARAR